MITNINEFKLAINEKIDSELKLKSIIIFDKDILNQEELLSLIRSLKGVTIINIIGNEENINNREFRIKINIKIESKVFNVFKLKAFKKELINIYGLNDVNIKYGSFTSN